MKRDVFRKKVLSKIKKDTITLYALSKISGVRISNLQRILSGKVKKPHEKTIRAIALAFEMTPFDLIRGTNLEEAYPSIKPEVEEPKPAEPEKVEEAHQEPGGVFVSDQQVEVAEAHLGAIIGGISSVLEEANAGMKDLVDLKGISETDQRFRRVRLLIRSSREIKTLFARCEKALDSVSSDPEFIAKYRGVFDAMMMLSIHGAASVGGLEEVILMITEDFERADKAFEDAEEEIEKCRELVRTVSSEADERADAAIEEMKEHHEKHIEALNARLEASDKKRSEARVELQEFFESRLELNRARTAKAEEKTKTLEAEVKRLNRVLKKAEKERDNYGAKLEQIKQVTGGARRPTRARA